MPAIYQWYLKSEKDNNCRCPVVRDLFSGRTLKVLVQAYSFTSQPIAEALINAHKHKIKVV